MPGSCTDDCSKAHCNGDENDTPIEKTPQSISVVTREEMDMKQPGTVKQALAYTPSVFATRGASTTYDVVSIRGFTTSSTVNTNQYLDGMKLQGDNYSEASMDPYFLERVELLRGRRLYCMAKAIRRRSEYGQQASNYGTVERNSVQNGDG